MTRAVPEGERGMILVNVLMFVAIASGLVLLMINREEVALDRSIRSREAARALAVVRGGELSALSALQRDARVAPEADYPGEPWGGISENGIAIDGGRFDLTIADAEGRFNVNSVRRELDPIPQLLFLRIARAAGIEEDKAVAAIALIRAQGPVQDLRPLAVFLPPEQAQLLARMVTALPGDTAINLNAATPELMAVLFEPAQAQRLIGLRNRQGYLSKDDLAREDVTAPGGTRFKSDHFWVRTRATIGETVQQGATLIQRVERGEGARTVRVAVPVERWRNAAIPPEVPGFG
ncbi:Type II secretory pathway component PulK-like protein [Sphingomonas sp. Leaf67]|uniref:general secretion pathway protein GspK n=1 Tax=unclassified Sphingomonas TaxID=196159 RepID=UPI0006F74801|nr:MULTISPECIES: type II secretion system protein GspK [unclassified Sphingomonas]KQN73910.1 Type II secretory pathway component PulK-like protein [Sphingomonas sp. Leaf62]KQN82892.1 Type II secretory pathway component PulK-like protein [Sphingomonas sp. Leaf67]